MSRAKSGFIGTDGYVHAIAVYDGTFYGAHCGITSRATGRLTQYLPVFRHTKQNSICPPCVTAIEEEHRRKV